MKGNGLISFIGITIVLGFHTLSLELDKYLHEIDGTQLYSALQQMLSLPGGLKEEEDVWMEEYIRYKKRYVKHLLFNQDLPNLSKFLISSEPL